MQAPSPPPTYMQPTLEQLQQQLDEIQSQLAALVELLAEAGEDETMPAALSLDGGTAYPDRDDGTPL